MSYHIPLAVMLAMSPLPLAAQAVVSQGVAQGAPVDRGYDKHTARHDAVDAQEKPVTESLNSRAAVEASGNRAAVDTVNSANQAQYEADMAAYRAEVQANRREMAADETRYDRQQRAYADAMATWREQKAACDRGVLKECKKPTPNPADFYGY